jgi:uncharacterized protein
MDLIVVFLTGLTVGGLTCLVVQGGLLASLIAAREESVTVDKRKHAFFVMGVFLVAKFFSYTLLGFVLGAFGGALNISGNVQTFMQLVAGVYMLAVALNLLDVHPIFRYVMIQPPRSLTRLVRNTSRSKDIFAPALLGVMTIFIPCGTTIAMEALAISSANAFSGALIMAVFTLGTIPLFFGIGFLTSILGDAFKTKFLKLAAVALFYLGISAINGSFIAFGFPVNSQMIEDTFQSGMQRGSNGKLYSEESANNNPTIYVNVDGYSPNYIRVKKGEPVNLKLVTGDAFSCAIAFRIPSLGLGKNLSPNDTYTMTFTPQHVGKIPFSCSMGMYTGVIEVI